MGTRLDRQTPAMADLRLPNPTLKNASSFVSILSYNSILIFFSIDLYSSSVHSPSSLLLPLSPLFFISIAMDSSIDNLDFLDQLFSPSTFSFSDLFSHDSDPLFNSLDFFSDDSSHFLNSIPSPSPNPSPRSAQSVTISGSGSSESDSNRKRISSSTGRVTKRKPRPSKKSLTTFITADAENFQQMVQQATGVNFPSSAQFSSMSSNLKQETKRIASFHACLPTLDTSAFLFDHNHHHYQVVASHGGAADAHLKKTCTPPDFDNLACFPTLDSWKVL